MQEDRGALVSLDGGARVTFALNPETFTDDKTTELASITIPGMSHPRLQFTGGGERTVSFTVSLHHSVSGNVEQAIHALQSWQYPQYSGGRLAKAPPRLLLIIGDVWPVEEWILRSCSVVRRRFDRRLDTWIADVSIELVEIVDVSADADDVRGYWG